MHAAEIFEQRPVRGKAAQARLPGVHMRVDEAGDDNAPAAIDDLGLRRTAAKLNAGTHLRDAAVLNQHIAIPDIADAIVHADDRC